ncbi:MAG: transcription elongation factor [Caldisphaeraceae archaeon]|nr:transcription elongation factor [Caldisphaeraceae archaeon]MEB3692106.1 transcription elongation factor [Caldisphaeraceae archaeon]MEB3797888.1 transcription elongation factor [Caldisphaeraceae archaeon]
MMFCPKCGGVMIPIKKNGKIILRCTKCGYEMKATEKAMKEYTNINKTTEKEKVLTTKTIGQEESTNNEETKEEFEQAKEEYYELVLDQMGEYGDSY